MAFNFLITKEPLFSSFANLGGRPCGTGFRPCGTPFLCLPSALLCTGIDDPWCFLVKPIKQY